MFITQEEMDAYYEDLRIISNIKFTQREIDVIACILNGRNKHKEIAILLDITANVVGTHQDNINKKLQYVSRSNIRDFVEKSNKLSIVRNHYTYLLHLEAFEETLKRIARISVTKDANGIKAHTVSIYFFKDKETSFLIGNNKKSGLLTHLKLAGFAVDLEDIRNIAPEKVGTKANIILLVSRAFINNFNSSNEIQNSLSFINNKKTETSQEYKIDIFFISIDEPVPNNLLGIISDAKTTLFRDNYYFSFFDFLLKLNIEKNDEIEGLAAKFQNNYHQRIPDFLDNLSDNTLMDKNKIIRSDLVIPLDIVLLDRKEIINEIDSKFSTIKHGIQTIVLAGIGGAGKTTIARQYARSQKLSVVYELNAETEISLRNSLGDLAHAIANTEEEKKQLQCMQEIQDLEEQSKQIINFTKQKLMEISSWLLIYDNLEAFSSVQKYFPLDSNTWGKGKVIITTRNSNIEHNSHINNFIYIGDMTAEQKYDLFIKIFSGISKEYGRDAMQVFLESIPSFPLDISIAARYLRETHTSLEQYLIHLREHYVYISGTQQSILIEVGDYKKTRYSIVTMSLHLIINTNPEFEDLLLFISLLDSQNIPRDLLDKYKNAIIVDDFIRTLKKYSMITTNNQPDLGYVFVLHRSTQDIILGYISNKLNKK